MSNEVSAELRLNNTLFLCKLENKYYNAREKKAYVLSMITDLAPSGPNRFNLVMGPVIICEDCYKENKEKGLNLKEPSPIVVAQPDIMKTLKRDRLNRVD